MTQLIENPVSQLKDMSYEQMLHMLKNGHCATRDGWNGKGMFMYVEEPSIKTVNGGPLSSQYPRGSILDVLPFIMMRTVYGKLVPWVASHTDQFSNDWRIL